MNCGAPPLATALQSRNPLAWLAIFGPGAVIASLTIGSGELIFSSRGGALFGYRLLWFFLVVLVLKWVLVFVTARHMVLTGAHPFQRWMELPGPRGWFPLVFFLLALVCFPIWVAFHAGTVGTLVSWLAGTRNALQGGAHFVWGSVALGVVLFLALRGGYPAQERIQLFIVGLMLACVFV
jgi:Mn2+/Fe2+ NRAMP family transporter